jgi:putative membrane protein
VKQATRTLALLLCLAACNGDDDENTAATTQTSTQPTAQRLTEAQVVGAVVSASEALALADSAALGVVKGASVWRYADVLKADHRAIAEEVRAVADTMKIAGQTSPISERLVAAASQLRTALADSTADHGDVYLEGQIAVQRQLIGSLDSVLIPSATTPALRQVLQDLRPAMVAHLQRAEQIKQFLATAVAPPRAAAARISPDSARTPGDSLAPAPPPTPRPDTLPKPDTIRSL